MIGTIKKFFKFNKVECPCCGWKGVEFIPHGVNNRKNAKCPMCKSLERHRLFFFVLKEHLPSDKPIKLLHFAPERSISKLFKSYENIDYLSADINPKRAMVAEDIVNLSFNDNTFDFVFCSDVLEHIPDDIRAISEIKRVLKPGGTAFISVPLVSALEHTYENPAIATPEERIKHFDHPEHVRKYGRDFIDRLKIKFANINDIDYLQTLSQRNIKKYGLKGRKVFLCAK